jgi:hypothetical protein
MICVERFHYDGNDGVECPECCVTVVLPPPIRDLITFLCPLCNKRYTLTQFREHVEQAMKEDPSIDPGE